MITDPDVLVVLLIAITTIYYLILWFFLGRDPQKETIVPLFEPPPNISPAGLRYIYQQGFDTKTFVVTIISLATKGVLSIKEDSTGIHLEKISQKEDDLFYEEKIVMDELFSTSNILHVDDPSQDKTNFAQSRLKKNLSAKYKVSYFNTHSIYFIPGLMLSIVSIWLIAKSSPDPSSAYPLIFLFVPLSIIGFYQCLVDTKAAVMINNHNRTEKTKWVVFTNIKDLIRGFAAVIFALILFSHTIAPIGIIAIFGMVIINMSFYSLLKAPTKEGRKLMDQIEGYKMFLATAEQYRYKGLNLSNPKLFEKNLPFAIALDIDNQWVKLFEANLTIMNELNYQPRWYAGSTHLSSLSNDLGSSLSSSRTLSPSNKKNAGNGS